MNQFIQRCAGALAAFVMLAGMTAAPVMAAAPDAPGCVGAGCRGRDPQAMGCAADARTLASAYAGNLYRVDLRYSPRCNARWSRTTLLQPTDWETAAFAYVGSGASTNRTGFGQSIWSAMWSGAIRACGGYNALNTTSTRCTATR